MATQPRGPAVDIPDAINQQNWKRGGAISEAHTHEHLTTYGSSTGLVVNAVAQNAVIHCERAPPKTSLWLTTDAVYGLPIPVASDRSSMVLIASTIYVTHTNRGTPKQHGQNHDQLRLPYRITAIKLQRTQRTRFMSRQTKLTITPSPISVCAVNT
jgi:hypothetical protein